MVCKNSVFSRSSSMTSALQGRSSCPLIPCSVGSFIDGNYAQQCYQTLYGERATRSVHDHCRHNSTFLPPPVCELRHYQHTEWHCPIARTVLMEPSDNSVQIPRTTQGVFSMLSRLVYRWKIRTTVLSDAIWRARNPQRA